MATFPALNYISDAGRTIAQQKQALEDFLGATKQIPGAGIAESTLTLATDEITPPSGAGGVFQVDTEGAAALDDLARIVQTNLPDGSLILLHPVAAGRTVRVLHNAGGTGQISLKTGANLSLGDPGHYLLAKRKGTLWEEIARFPGTDEMGEVALTAAYTVTAADREKLIDCTANTWTLTLLAAATAGKGFAIWVRNSGGGIITLDGNAAELIDGQSTIALYPGTKIRLLCTGTAWKIAMESSGTMTTGDVKGTFKTSEPGWVLMNDGTIGSAASGATTRANADTEALFTVLWTNVTNAWAPVSGGRGASAAADFAANKTLALPKALGRAMLSAGAGAGLTARALGETLGSENAVVVLHTHTATQASHSHNRTMTDGGNGAFSGLVSSVTQVLNQASSSVAPAITVNNAGVSGTGANMMPAWAANVLIKL